METDVRVQSVHGGSEVECLTNKAREWMLNKYLKEMSGQLFSARDRSALERGESVPFLDLDKTEILASAAEEGLEVQWVDALDCLMEKMQALEPTERYLVARHVGYALDAILEDNLDPCAMREVIQELFDDDNDSDDSSG